MKQTLWAILAFAVLASGMTGCTYRNLTSGCDSCSQGGGTAACRGGCGLGCKHRHAGPPPNGPAGPAAAQVAYPYYTTRGPRDFLMSDPPPLGP